MRNKIIEAILITSTLAVSPLMTSCKKSSPKFDYSNLFGMCEVSYDLSSAVDKGLTNSWIAERAAALKCKSFRIWISTASLFTTTEDDDLIFNQTYLKNMHDHVDKLKAAGVNNFLCLYSSFVYPFDYATTDNYCVPDPTLETDMYARFLKLNALAAKKIVQEFPEIKNVEPGNEPDLEGQPCIHKNGYVYNGTIAVNIDYLYTSEESASIVCDICYYCRKAVKEVGEEYRISVPGLSNLSNTDPFIGVMYEMIESKTLPYGQEKSDTDPDHYFDIINWHPYPNVTIHKDEPNEEWVEFQKDIHKVIEKHGDGDKPVYYSEMGWTTFGDDSMQKQEEIADYYIKMYDLVKKELPWVEVVFCFRMSCLKSQDISLGENNFGIFYNQFDPNHPGEPKAAAKALAKYFNGPDYEIPKLS